MTLAPKTARLTVLLDPSRKLAFERACREEVTTPSQVLRRLIRGYIEQRTGKPWQPDEPPRSVAAARRRG